MFLVVYVGIPLYREDKWQLSLFIIFSSRVPLTQFYKTASNLNSTIQNCSNLNSNSARFGAQNATVRVYNKLRRSSRRHEVCLSPVHPSVSFPDHSLHSPLPTAREIFSRAMSLPALAAGRAASVRPPRASAASGEAAAAAAADQPAGRRPVKVILPKKKPQKWSTGMAPGEYGGGPATPKPRKYWMGKEDRDPVGNTDDFIWNKDFLPHMERVIANGGADTPPTITRLTPVRRSPRPHSSLIARV